MIEYKRLQLRRDTSDNWYVSNPVLLEGEIGYETDTQKIKIGDGSTHWNDIDEWHTINNMGAVNSDLESALYSLKSDELPSIIFERLQEYTYSQYQINNAIEDAKDALQANIDTKVDNDTYQAKINEMEGNIEGKADQGDTYTKEEVDRLIAGAGAGVTKEYVDGEISRVESEMPSLEGYATEAWVEDKGYLTEHQDISNLATKEELPTKTSELTNDSGFLTEHQSLDDYYTKEEIDGKQQATDTTIATKADATETANRFNSVDEYLNTLHTEVEGKADAGSIPTKTSELENDSNFLTEHQPLKTINGETIVGEGNIEIKGGEQEFKAFGITQDTFKTNQEFLNAVEDVVNGYNPIGRYAIKNGDYPYICEEFHVSGTDVILVFVEHAQTKHGIIKISMDKTSGSWDGVWTGINGLADYYTKAETNNAIQGAKTALEGEINTKVDNDTYEGKISEIEGVLDVKADRNEIPSLSGYATESWVEAKGYLTEHQPLKTINGETIVGEGDIEIQGGGGNNWYGTEEEFNALGEYDESGNTLYHIEGQIDYKTDIKNLPLVPKKVSQLPNDAHYIQDVKKINGISMRGIGDIDIMKIIGKYHWWGTQEEYDAIEEKDANVQYHIEGDVPTETSSLIFELEDGTTKTIEVYIK